MSYQTERDGFIARMTREGLDLETIRALLRAATTLQRYAELACSSEAADRDRVECPASPVRTLGAARLRGMARKPTGPCCCDRHYAGNPPAPGETPHDNVPRITVQGDRLERRLAARLAAVEKPGDHQASGTWEADFQGDPRGYVLRVIPPSYAGRNQGKDRFNREAIGVPSGETRVRF